MKKELLEKPIFQMSGQDIMDLIGFVNRQVDKAQTKQRLIKGRSTLAAELGVAVTTVIKWESSGIIKPFNKLGRVLIYDLDQVHNDIQAAGKKNEEAVHK